MPTATNPAAVREAIRIGRWRGSTSGAAPGYAQANLLVVPGTWAAEVRNFCERNPRPCPLLDMTEPGSSRPMRVAPTADLRTDVAGYRIYERGTIRRVPDLRALWRDDLVSFVLGCSFSFEHALVAAGIPMRHTDLRRTVPMYATDRPCSSAGRLRGRLVVSMRPIPATRIDDVITICGRYPGAHGPPVHTGDPSVLGIHDLARPDYGDHVTIEADEVPAFWACGVTPQVVLRDSGCEWFASHEPGQMFVTDREDTIAPVL